MRRCGILQSTNPYACSSPCGPCPAGPTGPAGPAGQGPLFLLDTEDRLTVVPRAADTVVAPAASGTTVAVEFLSADTVPLYAVLGGTWEATLVTTATAVLSARFVASVVEANGTTDVPSLLEILAMSRSTRHCTPPIQVAVVDADNWQLFLAQKPAPWPHPASCNSPGPSPRLPCWYSSGPRWMKIG
jgi:hypothetical protein